jgi:hypothetical protein
VHGEEGEAPLIERARCDRFDREGGTDGDAGRGGKHLSTCPDCAESLRRHDWLAELLSTMEPADLEPPDDPPPGWEAALLARIDREFPPAGRRRGAGATPSARAQTPRLVSQDRSSGVRERARDDVDLRRYVRPVAPTIAAALMGLVVVGYLTAWYVTGSPPLLAPTHDPPRKTPESKPVMAPTGVAVQAPPPAPRPAEAARPILPPPGPTPKPKPAPACTTGRSAAELEGVVRSNAGSLRARCWQGAVNSGAATEARAVVYLEVAPDGHVSRSHLESGSGPREVLACISANAASWRFPHSCTVSKVNAPITLVALPPRTPER